MSDPIQNITGRLVSMALDAYALRHKVIANNVANIDTENYRPMQVDFESKLQALQDAANTGVPDAELGELIDQVEPTVSYRNVTASGTDVKGRLDDEMLALVQNTENYEAVLTVLQRRGELTHVALGDA